MPPIPPKWRRGARRSGSEILPYAESNPSGVPFIAVKRRVMVSPGDELTDASRAMTSRQPADRQHPLQWQGGRKFARVTQENVEQAVRDHP
jgi:preprotein translocase subunit SecD